MKYLIFLIAFMGVLPLGYILTLNRKYMRTAFYAVLLPVMAFNQVSINFFSHETYRGTSRGMEVSLVYLVAAAMLVGMLILIPFLSPPLLAVLFAVVAGIMVYISFDELLPMAERWGHHHLSIYGVATGMLIMALVL